MKPANYLTYGLVVRSDIPLWGATDESRPPDVTVCWIRGDTRPAAARGSPLTAADPRQEIRLNWPGICEMSILAGRRIEVRAAADAEVSHLRHLINGIGLGLVLHQRDVLTLHASAVALGGRGVALMGPKGAGKSTLAAALAGNGHALLSDDVVALDFADADANAPPTVRPGPTNLNLWPDSAVATGHEPTALETIWSRSPKLVGWVPGPDRQDPVPLAAVLILGGADEAPGFQQLPALSAFPLLVAHSHAFRWVDDPGSLPRHLEQCRAVLERVPVYRLTREASLDSLPTLVRRVEAHIASIIGEAANTAAVRSG